MIHIIYTYFIIAGIILGYQIGDRFDESNARVKLLYALFWLPVLLFMVVRKADMKTEKENEAEKDAMFYKEVSEEREIHVGNCGSTSYPAYENVPKMTISEHYQNILKLQSEAAKLWLLENKNQNSENTQE